MSDADPFSAYLQLAEKVFKREVKLNALSAYIRTLPPLDRELLERLAEESEKASLTRPRMSWAICCVAEKASRQQKLDLFTRSLAAWYLGRAANRWVQPQKIAKAIARAQKGFSQLNELYWLALCNWQKYYCTWAIDDLTNSEIILRKVVLDIENSEVSNFLPNCLLTLSEILILLEKHEEAEKYISICETTFFKLRDELELARCWLVHANCLRRQSKFKRSLELFGKSEFIFSKFHSICDMAKCYYYRGILLLFSTTDFQLTSKEFFHAIDLFIDTDLELWKGMSDTYLGITCVQVGQHEQATLLYRKAEIIFRKHKLISLLAQNFNAKGSLLSINGQLEESILILLQAKQLHLKSGRLLMAARDTIAIGNVFFQQGRFQDALRSYESIIEIFTSEKDVVHLGLFHLYLANYWLFFRNFEMAGKLLLIAESNLALNHQEDTKININNSRALVLYELGEIQQSKKLLFQSLQEATNKKLKTQIATTNLNLGNLFISENNYNQALTYLNESRKQSLKLGMQYELASSMVSLGICYSNFKKDHAIILFKDALQISENTYNDLAWRSYVALAELDTTNQQINYYRLAIRSISNIRNNFWQPHLAGAYLAQPELVFDKAIEYSIKNKYIEDAINFIDTGKSTCLIQLISTLPQINSGQKLQTKNTDELRSSINKIKKQIYILNSEKQPFKSNNEVRILRKELLRITDQYQEQLTKEERRKLINNTYAQNFDLSKFIGEANERFSHNWIAFDYYLIKDRLYIAIISPFDYKIKNIKLDHGFFKLLHLVTDFQNGFIQLSPFELKALGNYLIPKDILNNYSSDTILIISPHQILHGIPWAAIGDPPLVKRCIPIIIPSLNTLQELWRCSPINKKNTISKGLIIGVSSFEGRYEDLPNVKKEIESISSINGKTCESVYENINSFSELKEIIHHNSITYDCLHLATHFFNDQRTGIIGGFALKKEDIWLDQIRDLYPLPRIITLSGCNSLYSKIMQGDEQISLVSTCFLAGSENIIGSVWPIIDSSTTSLITDFYNNLFNNYSPSSSLSLAQRNHIDKQEDLSSWSSFLCLGTR
jgi:tetratricopeptide (TPR) repeat protein